MLRANFQTYVPVFETLSISHIFLYLKKKWIQTDIVYQVAENSSYQGSQKRSSVRIHKKNIIPTAEKALLMHTLLILAKGNLPFNFARKGKISIVIWFYKILIK